MCSSDLFGGIQVGIARKDGDSHGDSVENGGEIRKKCTALLAGDFCLDGKFVRGKIVSPKEAKPAGFTSPGL